MTEVETPPIHIDNAVQVVSEDFSRIIQLMEVRLAMVDERRERWTLSRKQRLHQGDGAVDNARRPDCPGFFLLDPAS